MTSVLDLCIMYGDNGNYQHQYPTQLTQHLPSNMSKFLCQISKPIDPSSTVLSCLSIQTRNHMSKWTLMQWSSSVSGPLLAQSQKVRIGTKRNSECVLYFWSFWRVILLDTLPHETLLCWKQGRLLNRLRAIRGHVLEEYTLKNGGCVGAIRAILLAL